MIPEIFVEQWRSEAPWQTLAMVEQDLVISRALIELFLASKCKSTNSNREISYTDISVIADKKINTILHI